MNDQAETATGPVAVLPLWKAFLIAVGGSIVFGIVLAIFVPVLVVDLLGGGDTAAEITGWIVFDLFYLCVMIALWLNAYNTNKKVLGHLARVYAVLTTLLFLAIPSGIIVDS